MHHVYNTASHKKHIKTLRFNIPAENLCLIGITILGFLGAIVLIMPFIKNTNNPIQCKIAEKKVTYGHTSSSSGQLQLEAILHYATTAIVPQQTIKEIRVSFDVLQKLAPCNFLVFGLGRDSLMWASLNPHGTTLFLEEDPRWVSAVLESAPNLNARVVEYRTHLYEADELAQHFRTERECWAKMSYLRGNSRCRLALDSLPDEVYEKEWDLIMIDAPRGWFPKAPGRMAVIYSAAVMARNRKKSGVTHVFLHDVNRKAERTYAEMFLCRKYFVKGVGRLWHFEIPPHFSKFSSNTTSHQFC
ncbi:unnamed protein product [Cuscuta epithymum]|uniref:Polysaccharide biosynthesis domain-containing protein n=2 Tax=Cuscuta epithymum TaxID=186058 RepID=A0AAV0CH95_9ASTE|nr:unnamed protein product [Cuscuta epithymum]